jgi:hypothetical protein
MRAKKRLSWGPSDLFIVAFYFRQPVQRTGSQKYGATSGEK